MEQDCHPRPKGLACWGGASVAAPSVINKHPRHTTSFGQIIFVRGWPRRATPSVINNHQAQAHNQSCSDHWRSRGGHGGPPLLLSGDYANNPVVVVSGSSTTISIRRREVNKAIRPLGHIPNSSVLVDKIFLRHYSTSIKRHSN